MNTTTYTDDQAYTIIVSTLPQLAERMEIRRTRTFNDFTKIWNKNTFNSAKRVGRLMSTIATLPEDATRKDWTMLFFYKNLGPAAILAQVEELAEIGNIDFKTALTYWWIHLQDSVYDGWKDEVTIGEFIRAYAQSKGYETRGATDAEDRGYGVDVIVFDPKQDNKVIVGVQIKGERYFTSTRENVIKARNIIDPPKYHKFTQDHGAEVWYAMIESTIKTNGLVWRRADCYKK